MNDSFPTPISVLMENVLLDVEYVVYIDLINLAPLITCTEPLPKKKKKKIPLKSILYYLYEK